MSETTPPGEPRLYSIVVLGAMNPRLHYPLWYSLIGALTEDEANSGRESKDFSVTPYGTQFAFADYRIICLMDRWEISTALVEHRERILKIACTVFEKLNETPISAFGFNTFADLGTSAAKVNDVLALLASRTGLGFSNDGERSCQYFFINTKSFQTTNITIRPSAIRENMVWVAYNSHFVIESQKGYYDLSKELIRYFDPHWKEATAFSDGVIRRISEIAGGTLGN
jgi:hypothetical protein